MCNLLQPGKKSKWNLLKKANIRLYCAIHSLISCTLLFYLFPNWAEVFPEGSTSAPHHELEDTSQDSQMRFKVPVFSVDRHYSHYSVDNCRLEHCFPDLDFRVLPLRFILSPAICFSQNSASKNSAYIYILFLGEIRRTLWTQFI